jgi:hypothetical protein
MAELINRINSVSKIATNITRLNSRDNWYTYNFQVCSYAQPIEAMAILHGQEPYPSGSQDFLASSGSSINNTQNPKSLKFFKVSTSTILDNTSSGDEKAISIWKEKNDFLALLLQSTVGPEFLALIMEAKPEGDAAAYYKALKDYCEKLPSKQCSSTNNGKRSSSGQNS